jgi:hypothetical protein
LLWCLTPLSTKDSPVHHQKNIIWTSEASVHIIFFWWRTDPYTAIWPSVPCTICYLLLWLHRLCLICRFLYTYNVSVPSNVNVRLNKITSGIIFVLLCLESVNTEIPEEIVKLNIIVIIWGVISKRIKISPHTREIIDTRHVHLIPQTVHDTTLTLDGTWCIFVMDIIVFILLIPRS